MTETSVAVCGLFCGNCLKFKQGTCQGCAAQAGMGRCKIRAGAFEKGFATCAECDELDVSKHTQAAVIALRHGLAQA